MQNSSKLNLDALSLLPSDGRKIETSIYVDVNDVDNVSAPTVEGSFSDEDFSIMSEKSFLATHQLNLAGAEDNSNLSLSSVNTKGLLKITELTKRLRLQEATKLELLNQCLDLENKLEKNDCKNVVFRDLKQENNQLREASAKMERDFMNEMNLIATRMEKMEEDYKERLKKDEERIKALEEEIDLLKVAKNLDKAS